MASTTWLKQSSEPLFEDILWSRPENKKAAGKLLVIGGHKLDFFGPLSAFEVAMKAGIGECRVAMPSSVAKEILSAPQVVSVAKTPSGGISPDAKPEILAMAADVSGVVFPGSLGKDSGTVRLLEGLLSDIDNPITLTMDGLDSAIMFSPDVLSRDNLHLVAALGQLSTLSTNLNMTTAITHNIQLTNLVEQLAEITTKHKFMVSTYAQNQIITAKDGSVVSTKLEEQKDKEKFAWRAEFATISAVIGVQFLPQPLEAAATAAWIFSGK